MKPVVKYAFFSCAYGIYMVCMGFFVDAFGFLNAYPSAISSIAGGLLVAGILLMSILQSERIQRPFFSLLIVAVSIVLTPQIGALLLMLLSDGAHLPILYFLGFFAFSLLPLCLFLMWEFFSGHQLIQSKNMVGDTEDTPSLVFPNGKGKPLSVISFDVIKYLEASDNYVIVHYIEDDLEKTSMHRYSLKSAEDQIRSVDSKSFFRVHKSFIVNQLFVDSIEGKSQSYRIKIKNSDLRIPVSRNYNISSLKEVNHSPHSQ